MNESKFKAAYKNKSKIFPTVTDLLPPEYHYLRHHQYPFENIVFEGGGARGAAYYGVIKILEEVGVRDQIKRIGGASAGAMTALIFVCGCTAEYLKYLFTHLDFRALLDTPKPLFCFGDFGRRSGERIYNFFGKMVKNRFGKADLTFAEFGKELCIIVTNLNYLDIDYCHPKTTPNLPIRLAVRMSLSLPIEFSVIRHGQLSGPKDLYTDGGLLCNFPIHCFDGWFLSMKPEDNFFSKLKPGANFEDKFRGVNWKTIGCLLYSDSDREILSDKLRTMNSRPDDLEIDSPHFRRYMKALDSHHKTSRKDWEILVNASHAFLACLEGVGKSGTIERPALEEHITKALSDPGCQLTDRHLTLLFGEKHTLQSIMNALDRNGDGQIEYEELVYFMGQRGVDIKSLEKGYRRVEVKSFAGMINCILDSLLINNQRLYIKEEDVDRTIGIDTFYIESTDFDMSSVDKEFLTQQGTWAIIKFLERYVQRASQVT